MTIFIIFSMVLTTLKLMGLIEISWLLVTLPAIAELVLDALFILLFLKFLKK